MAFQKNFQLSPEQLTKETQLRFLEFELSRYHYIIQQQQTYLNHDLTKRALSASKILTNILHVHEHPRKQELENTFNHYDFQNPSHDVKVQYFRYKNLGIKKIRQFVTAKTTELIKGGIYDTTPHFQPIFKHWEEMSSIQFTWNMIKHHFNLFNEPLIHETEAKQTNPVYLKQTPTPTPQQPETIIPLVPSEPLEWTVGRVYTHDEMVQLLGIPHTPDDKFTELLHILSYIFPGVIEEVEADTTFRILKEKADAHIRSDY